MIGTQPVGTISGVVISAVSHEGISVTVDGKAARLAILTDDQKAELLALMWLGRADAGETVEMWSDLVTAAHEEDHKTAALLGKSPLGTYLSKGLDYLKA